MTPMLLSLDRPVVETGKTVNPLLPKAAQSLTMIDATTPEFTAPEMTAAGIYSEPPQTAVKSIQIAFQQVFEGENLPKEISINSVTSKSLKALEVDPFAATDQITSQPQEFGDEFSIKYTSLTAFSAPVSSQAFSAVSHISSAEIDAISTLEQPELPIRIDTPNLPESKITRPPLETTQSMPPVANPIPIETKFALAENPTQISTITSSFAPEIPAPETQQLLAQQSVLTSDETVISAAPSLPKSDIVLESPDHHSPSKPSMPTTLALEIPQPSSPKKPLAKATLQPAPNPLLSGTGPQAPPLPELETKAAPFTTSTIDDPIETSIKTPVTIAPKLAEVTVPGPTKSPPAAAHLIDAKNTPLINPGAENPPTNGAKAAKPVVAQDPVPPAGMVTNNVAASVMTPKTRAVEVKKDLTDVSPTRLTEPTYQAQAAPVSPQQPAIPAQVQNTDILPKTDQNLLEVEPDSSISLRSDPDRLIKTEMIASSQSQPNAVVSKSVAIQIAQAASAGAERPVEITLDPVELGKVRLTLQATDTGMNVQIILERAETMDLMRRNSDILAAELEELGYQDLNFTFSQDGQEAQFENGENEASDLIPAAENNTGIAPENRPSQSMQSLSNTGSDTGLDLRL